MKLMPCKSNWIVNFYLFPFQIDNLNTDIANGRAQNRIKSKFCFENKDYFVITARDVINNDISMIKNVDMSSSFPVQFLHETSASNKPTDKSRSLSIAHANVHVHTFDSLLSSRGHSRGNNYNQSYISPR